MPNVMVALPSIGGALCSTPQRPEPGVKYRYDVYDYLVFVHGSAAVGVLFCRLFQRKSLLFNL